jgi:ComF family protein
MSFVKTIADSFIHLFYPHICCGCGSDLLQAENLICLKCMSELPETEFALYPNNPVEKTFWGRLAVRSATSQYYFTKNSLIQSLVHQLKYQGNQDIGIWLGKMMGRSFLQTSRFSNIDLILPLPLFPEKEKRRGYNQASLLCDGISEIVGVPVYKNTLRRLRHTETQTHKSRIERWQNVDGVFHVQDPGNICNKAILLVDDVITTGATLEACGNELLKVAGISLSIATLAYAVQ